MDVGCNCVGMAAASRRPVKRYNLLVPDIWPKKQPAFEESVDATTERKFKKLVNYLEKTPERAPKARSLPDVCSPVTWLGQRRQAACSARCTCSSVLGMLVCVV